MYAVSSLPKQLIDIYNDFTLYSEKFEPSTYSKEWKIQGWVRDFRSQADNAFVSVYDGSTSETFQLVCSRDKTTNFDNLENLRGATIYAEGIVIKSPAKGQLIEMVCDKIEPIGLVQDKNSIILAKNVQLETLRGFQHLRSRFRSFGYIYKIRSTLLKHIHNFFHSNRFYNLDPNIITTSDCEGGGEAFTITSLDTNELIVKAENILNEKLNLENDLSSKSETKTKLMSEFNVYSNDFFRKRAFLTVSSQLQLEALTAGLSRVYTLNPSFRAEKSKTKRHLGCFTHLEWEIAFININQLMDFSEGLVKSVIGETLKECVKEYEELNKFLSKGIINKLTNVINNPFERITYSEAVSLIEKNKQKILQTYSKEITESDIPKWGDDLGSYCEKFICDHIYSKPVFVYNYPIELKSFYMKANNDNKTCMAVDLLCPQLGELIGSSIREDSFDKLINRMNDKSMDKSVLEWYLDLRKNSQTPTGGAGLGFDRLVNFCSLMDGNIRDVVPFPVAFEECEY
jgi:asparaginyl-tRNA synthetase